MKLRTILLTAGAGVLLVGGATLPILRAQHPGDGPMFRRSLAGFRLRRAAERLHVTPTQKTAALEALRKHQPTLKPLVDQVIKERFALHKLSEAPTVDEAAVRAASARVAAAEADLAVQKAYLFHDLRAVATPEQLNSIDQMETDAETRLLKVVDLVSNWIARS